MAVVGVGVAGSYLLARLEGRCHVTGFESSSLEKHYPICAWGTSINAMREIAREVGLNFDDYVLYKGREMLVDLGEEEISIRLKGLCTFDKLRFEEDLIRGRDVRFGVRVYEPPRGFDLIIDATGFNRALLPRPRENYFIPTIEYRVKYPEGMPFNDFYIKPLPELSGYLWFFPLGDSVAHVGAGDYYKRHVKMLEEFMHKYGGEILRKVGRPVRITPPHFSEPIYEGRVVGVGEAVGTVYPILGEGIIPSIESAKLLIENIENLELYRRKLLRKFAIYEKIFRLIKKRMTSGFSWIRDLGKVASLYLHMRLRENRYGIEARLPVIMKVLGGNWRRR